MTEPNKLETPQTDDRAARLRQTLGMKGADVKGSSIWKIRLQLMKPVTWIPLMWGVLCGAASSGRFTWTFENVAVSLACMLMSGPLLTGYTQTINDYYDRDIDAINEPYRPIPSGAISLGQVKAQVFVLLGLGLTVSYLLDLWAGHALFGELNQTVMVLTLFYSLAGLGIAIVNDFKSVEGDRAMGLDSLPVIFGITRASWICVLMIDIFQALMAAYLISVGENLYATILILFIIPQITLQDMYFLRDPVKNDVKYQASAQPFLVLGMLVTGIAMGHNVLM